MRKRRIAHVITRMSHGGAMDNTLQTVLHADADRYEVDLVCGPTPLNERSMDARMDALGVNRIVIPSLKRTPNPIADLDALNRLTRLYMEREYDLVHTHTSKAGFVGRMAARRVGIKRVVHTPHGHIFHGYFTAPIVAIYTALERRVAKYTQRIIALTDDEITEHLDRGIGTRDQYVSIPSGVDVEAFAEARARRAETRSQLNVSDDDCVVLGAGRLEPVKGFTYFIKAAHLVDFGEKKTEFWIAGDGSLRKSLEDEAANSNVPIRFLGWRDDLPDVMAAADVLVVPSLNEGMGRVIAEAGAAGLPVVASATGGIPHILADGETGILTPPGDADAIARAIEELCSDESRREAMGAAGRERIRADYSVETMVRQIEDLYEELFANDPID